MAIRWGIIGSGRIIPRFMAGLTQVAEAVPAAIYARDRSKAQTLADRYGIPQVFNDIDAFIRDAKIDVAYIAVTHPLHLQFALKTLSAKIPTLCEKPMCPNREQEQAMVECAKANDTFLAEAFWTRMFPVTLQVKQWVTEGRIGKVAGMNSIFGYNAGDKEGDRLFMPEHAGGALLDIGVYQVQAASLIFGKAPDQIVSLAGMNRHHTDDNAGLVFRYGGGEIATMLTTFRTNARNTLTIYGSNGIIEVYDDFFRPRHARLVNPDGIIEFHCPEQRIDSAMYSAEAYFTSEGYQYEVRHIHDCLQQGLKESPLIPLQESLDIIATCDAIRAQWGLKYPFEN